MASNVGLKPLPVVPECEVFLEGEEGCSKLKSRRCEKNPGHDKFIPVKDFKEENLPEHLRSIGWKAKLMTDRIRNRINRTVLIRVFYTSMNRPDTYTGSNAIYPYSMYKGSGRVSRTGTGFIVNQKERRPVIGECPCRECKQPGAVPCTKYWMYHVTTATHVVFDSLEAERATIECFYDDEEHKEEEVVKLFGVSVGSKQSTPERCQSDWCDAMICVTHDETSAENIDSRIDWRKNFFQCTSPAIVSHPHGSSKMITFGKLLCATFNIKNAFYHNNTPRVSDLISWTTTAPLKFKPRTTTTHALTTISGPTTITLPRDAKYAMRYHYDNGTATFPPGTEFTSKVGAAIPIPDNTLFEKNESFRFDLPVDTAHILTYDIPTCPGSSGALLPHPGGLCALSSTITHCGWDSGRQCNRSCDINPLFGAQWGLFFSTAPYGRNHSD